MFNADIESAVLVKFDFGCTSIVVYSGIIKFNVDKAVRGFIKKVKINQ